MRSGGPWPAWRALSSRRLRPALATALVTLLCGAAGAATAAAADPTVAAVGDMACSPTDASYNGGDGTATRCRQRYVSDLVAGTLPDALLDLGDNQYVNGELANYNAVYGPTFGRANSIVYPSIGNAEYGTAGAQGFFDYFSSAGVFAHIQATSGDASHLLTGGFYSFDVGAWHMIALNSNCAEVGGCGAGSPQEAWLKADLAANPGRCTLAYWHHPRWNAGNLGNDSSTAAFWTDLYNARADLVLNGHGNHHYERYLPQSPAGVPDPTKGVREFIVSTGGESHGSPPTVQRNTTTMEVSDYTSFGVLRLTLHPTGYDWRFVPAVGGSFTDSGTGSCHSATPVAAPGAPSLSAAAGDHAVSLSWAAPASDGGAPITGYNIYRGTSSGSTTLLKSIGNVTSYDDLSASNATKYFYRVAAVNSAGEGAKSTEVSATPVAAPVPDAPLLDDFSGAAGPLGASWQSPALADAGTVSVTGGGQAASSAGVASATWKAGTFVADQDAVLTVATLPRVGNFLQVAGRVSTLGTAGLSCYLLRVTPSSGTWDLRAKVNGATSVSLATFSAPLVAGDAVALQLVGPTLKAYRRTAGGSWTLVGYVGDSSVKAAGYVAFTLGDTTARASGFAAAAVAAQPANQVPGAPSLTANGGDGTVSLSWTAPASDGGAAITAYNVYRGTSAGGESLLTSVGNVTSYADGAVVNGTTYFYRVAAVNSVGEGAQSNESSATPRAAAPAPSPPTASVLDDFNRAAGPLGSSWQSPGLADAGTVTIATSGQTASSAGAASATWRASTFPADQEGYLTVATLPRAGGFLQVAGRVSTLGTAGLSCYLLRVTPSTGVWDLRKKINGATSVSLKTFTAQFNAGDTLALQLVGSTISAFRRSGAWSFVGSASDGAIAAGGYLSFTLGDVTVRGGTFGGGAVT
jgi:hypothetical protein